jgi:osmotically-inducible protein OsmY
MISSTVTDIQLRVQTALATSHIYNLRCLTVRLECAQILLSGRVESFYQKQMAQEIARSVSEEVEVCNSIDVRLK